MRAHRQLAAGLKGGDMQVIPQVLIWRHQGTPLSQLHTWPAKVLRGCQPPALLQQAHVSCWEP